MEILDHDKNKEWFIGLSLKTYKHMDDSYDYWALFKVNCLYKFHRDAIIEIPNWQTDEINNLLERKTTRKGLPYTGYRPSETNYISNIPLNQIKLIS